MGEERDVCPYVVDGYTGAANDDDDDDDALTTMVVGGRDCRCCWCNTNTCRMQAPCTVPGPDGKRSASFLKILTIARSSEHLGPLLPPARAHEHGSKYHESTEHSCGALRTYAYGPEPMRMGSALSAT